MHQADRRFQLRKRAEGIRKIRDFFTGRDFLEVETPILVPSPGLDLHLDAFEVPRVRGEQSYYLNTSPEYQMKRLLGQGFDKIFQITKVFRQGELGERHNPEFTMLEWYRLSDDYDQIMKETEDLVASVTCGEITIGGKVTAVRPPFERRTLASLFRDIANVGEDEFFQIAEQDEDRFFRILVDRVEPFLEQHSAPIFVTEYPAVFASLARRKPGDPRVAERFELYLSGVELCNGFGELTDPTEQRLRFESDQHKRRAVNRPVYPIDERFLSTLEQGLAPCVGNALGVDRLLALAAGTRQISEVLSFSFEGV